MGVFLRKTKDGYYPLWLGFFQADGKRHEHSLCPWKGTPPAPGEDKGDEAFEKSRARAEAMFKKWRAKGKSAEEELADANRVHALRYGAKVERVKLADLSARWDAFPHKADLTEERKERVHSVLRRFVTFMHTHFPKVTEAGELDAEHFKAFLADVDESGVSARTWNDYMETVRSVLRKVDGQSKGFREYLADLPKRKANTIHRRPFKGDELEAVFAAAKATDPELYPVLVAAACTALRRGDVCRLRWSDIDLAEDFVTVLTTKTGEKVDIPIFPPFRAVLEEAAKTRKPGERYVFPEIAAEYAGNSYGLNYRLSRVLESAGFTRPELPAGESKAKSRARKTSREYRTGARFPAPASPGDAVEKVDAAIREAGWSEERRQKGLAILQKTLEGKTRAAVAAELEIAKGAVSTYLHDMEDLAKVAIVSPPVREGVAAGTGCEDTADAVPAVGPAMVAAKEDGKQRKLRGSLCGFHAFRTTFCTLALANGVPMEILRKITGHRTVEIVLKHYDRRGREAMRKAFGAAMPRAIVGTVGEAARPVKARVDAGDALEGECVELAAAAPSKRSPADALADLLEGASEADLAAVRKLLARRAKK